MKSFFRNVVLLVAVGSALLSNLATASDAASDAEKLKASQQRELAFLAAPIKTREDLNTYLDMTYRRSSPLDKLPASDREAFLESLTFNETGVTSFLYSPFRNLNAADTYQILALFGVQHTTARIGSKVRTAADKTVVDNVSPMVVADHYDYKCTERATCTKSYDRICMNGC